MYIDHNSKTTADMCKNFAPTDSSRKTTAIQQISYLNLNKVDTDMFMKKCLVHIKNYQNYQTSLIPTSLLPIKKLEHFKNVNFYCYLQVIQK
jgi:hypothetical protein